MTVALAVVALVVLGLLIGLALVLRRRGPHSEGSSPEQPESPFADPPPALMEAKAAFERANAKLLAAQEAWRTAAEEVNATGAQMTAIYQEWAKRRTAAALEQNNGRRASVFDRMEQADELLGRPLPRPEQ